MKILVPRLCRVTASDLVPQDPRRQPLLPSRQPDGSHRNPRHRRRKNVPEGHLPLYVGDEMQRFVVPADLLSCPALAELLRRSAQEYGYDQRGVLRIPCPVKLFERVLLALQRGRRLDGVDEECTAEVARVFSEDSRVS